LDFPFLSNLRAKQHPSSEVSTETVTTTDTAPLPNPSIQQIFKAKLKYVEYIDNEYFYIPGQLTLTQHQLIFEPNLDHPRVKKYGSLNYTIVVEMDDISDVMPVKPMDPAIDDTKKAYLMVGLDDSEETEEEDNLMYFCLKKERVQVICNQMEGLVAKEQYQTLIDKLDLDEAGDPTQKRRRKSFFHPDSDKETEANDPYIGELLGTSQLIPKKSFIKLRTALPVRYRNYNWRLLFSTARDGTSLNTFHLRMSEHGGPTVLVMEDTNGYVFGGFASEEWRIQDSFFGTGETFVFSLLPKFFVYKWTGGNDYFLHATKEFIGMGGGASGRYALYIDSEFNWGTSGTSNTFLNRRLSCNEEFSATIVEVWGFTTSDS